MKFPKHLSKNGTIGYVAPSFGCYIEPYHTAFGAALEKFKELGHGADLGPNCCEGSGLGISNTPQKCADELVDYYCSNKNEVLISCGGGELMCEILEYIDFEKIKNAAPKWFMGYSDNTNFTFLLATICDTAAIYGPCASEFGMKPWHPAVEDAYRVLCGETTTVHEYGLWEKDEIKSPEKPLAPYNVTEPGKLQVYTQGTYFIKENQGKHPDVHMQGRLLGGCMDCLVNLLGTSFDYVAEFNERYKEEGVIWFLESCDLNVMSIRRAIWQMEHAGWFQYTKGFLIGRPGVHGQELMGLDQYHAVCDLLAKYKVPIIMDLDIGHLPPMMPLICGSLADVTVQGNHITIEMNEK